MNKIKTKVVSLFLVEIVLIPFILFGISYLFYYKTDFPFCHLGFFDVTSKFYGICLTYLSIASLFLSIVGIKYFRKDLVYPWIIFSVVSFIVGITICLKPNLINKSCPCGCLMN